MLPEYFPSFTAAEDGHNHRNIIIQTYFKCGFQYAEILAFLFMFHGISLSLRHLKRIIKILGLRRRLLQLDIGSILDCIELELGGSRSCVGYRQMHQCLRDDHGLVVDRNTVRIILKHLDPDGVSRRKRGKLKRRRYTSKGPNYLWHIDGYDKLKPFGFCIHGAIDGYSRRIMWLEVASSNNDPAIVAHYYVDCVEQIGGCPMRVRADAGTENVTTAALQRFYRSRENDEFSGMDSFLYGKSTSNQDLIDAGLHFDDDELHVECLRFCFMDVIQSELYDAARHWNLHRIRPYPSQVTPPGKPDVLYFMPELEGTKDYKTEVSPDNIELARTEFCRKKHEFGCKSVFSDVFIMLMQENGLHMPNNADEAKTLYVLLMSLLEAEL